MSQNVPLTRKLSSFEIPAPNPHDDNNNELSNFKAMRKYATNRTQPFGFGMDAGPVNPHDISFIMVPLTTERTSMKSLRSRMTASAISNAAPKTRIRALAVVAAESRSGTLSRVVVKAAFGSPGSFNPHIDNSCCIEVTKPSAKALNPSAFLEDRKDSRSTSQAR
jgi:hypothetical protein